MTPWSYSINYGPDGQEDWANLITPNGQHVANIRTHHAIAIVNGMNRASALGTAPADTGVGWENLSCDDQYRLARQIASNVGYVLTPEPSIQAAEDTAATAAEIRVGVLREAADTARDVVRGCNEPWQRAGEAIYDALRALSEGSANGK